MLLNYSVASGVSNLFVVPKHFFVTDIIEERKPLADTARRAGWVGCNILLSHVPDAGEIFIVRDEPSWTVKLCSINGSAQSFFGSRATRRKVGSSFAAWR